MKDRIFKYLENLKRLSDAFGFLFMINCLIRRMISFKLYERYMYKYLTYYFDEVIKKFKDLENNKVYFASNDAFHIWTLWWQGEKNAPDLVKLCINSQKQNLIFTGIEYHVLTKQNWKKYIDLPQFILDKVNSGDITLTHFSDIIRAELLRKYGGVWIDATVLCTQRVDLREEIKPFFTIKAHESSEFITMRRWTGFFIGDSKSSLLFDFMAEAFRYYWKKENNLIVYLLIDYLIAIAYDQFNSVRERIDAITVNHEELWSLLRKMNSPYDENEWKKITASTSFFKLSYKDEFNGGALELVNDGIITYYGMLKKKYTDKVLD